jgi:fibronectin-binding autotransporter adhesin
MNSMKVFRQFARIIALSAVGFLGLLASNARSAVLTENFDVNGATAGFGVTTGSTYDWDSATNGGFWSNNATSTTGGQATNAWPQGNFPKFQPAGTPTYTINVSNNEQITGIFASTAQNLTINATGGGLEAVAGVDGFLGSSSADVTINAVIKGAGQVNPSNGGNLRFNGANTYTGGTLLNSTSTLVHFGNDSSFGAGDITMSVAGFVPLLASGGTTRTIANNFVSTVTGTGINFAADAATPVISTGTWTLGANNLVLRNNGVSTSPLTISNVISGAAGTTVTVSGANGGTVNFNSANTYGGGTTVGVTSATSITLAIGNNSALGAGPLTLSGGAVAAGGGPRAITNNTTINVNSSVAGTNNLAINGSFTNSGANRVLTSTNTGSTTLGGNVYLSELAGTGRTLILAGSTTNNPVFAISGNISDFNGSGAAGSIQVGNGTTATQATLTLSGSNTHSGATNVSTGSTLKIGSANALGTSTLTFTGSSNFFDNTTGAALVLTNNMALPNGSPTFIGTDDLTLGNLAISAANRTVSVSAKTLTVNDVTQDSARNLTKGGAGKLVIKGNASYTGTTTVNGGTLQIGNGVTTGTLSTSSAIVDNANLTFNRSNSVSQGVDFAAGPITGTGTLTKEGAGILTLTGKNTYGTVGVVSTTVNAGTLLVNTPGPDSGTGVGDVLVAGGKLGGTGRIGGSVSVTSGDLSPGASINVLDIGGNLSMTGGAYDYEINSSSSTADLNTVAGNLSLASVALSASELGSGMLAYGTKFTLINYGGLWNGGIFTGLPNYSTTLTIGANRFFIKYNDTTGGSNFGGGSYGFGSGQPHYVTITAVPEASTFLVIGLGGVFAFAAVRLGKRLGVKVLNA